jgi:hypothetical protein
MLKPIPIDKGVFQNADPLELADPSFAAEMRNLVLTDSGANTDRPGLSLFANTGTAFGIAGLFYFSVSGTVVAVDEDRRIWSLASDGTLTEIGGLDLGGTSRPKFADDGELLAIAGGGAPQTWTGTGVTTPMAGSPPDCDSIDYLDGYWITHLLNDQEFRIAGPTQSTRLTWNTSDFFQAEGLPDNVLAQAVLLRELYSFGSQSTEIFQNFGSAQPFQRTFFVDRGIGAPHSLIQFDNTLAWLDNRRRIVQMQNRTPVQIDSPYDRTIQGFSTVDDCWAANVESLNGYYFAVWTFPTEHRSFAYDYKNQQWFEWDGFADGESARLPIHSHVFVESWNKHLVGDPAAGRIYQLTFDAKTDAERTMRRLRRTGAYSHGTSCRKRSNYYLFHIKRGLIPNDGSTPEPVFQVRVNDDNKGWSDPILVPLGFQGSQTGALRVRCRGIYRRRQLEIQMTDAAEFLLAGIEEDVELMLS